MKLRDKIILMFFSAVPLTAQEPAVKTLTLKEAVLEALDKSPQVLRNQRLLEEASLEEPLILSATDPQLEILYSFMDDQAPRAAPTFEGPRAKLNLFETTIAAKTLLGTQARFVFRNELLKNPSLFRVLDPSADTRLNLEVSQPLLRYFWGRPDIARRSRARLSMTLAEANLRQAKIEIAARVIRSYLEYHLSREETVIKEGGVDDAKKLLSKYEEKRRYGLVEASDLEQARAFLQTQETELILAQSRMKQAGNNLLSELQLLELNGKNNIEIAPPIYPLTPNDTPLERTALDISQRGDVLAARAVRESANWNKRIVELDNLPDLSLNASLGYAGLDLGYHSSVRDLSTWEHPVKTIGASFIVPFGFKKERLTLQQAKLRAETAGNDENRVKQKAILEANNALENIHLTKQRVTTGKRLLELEQKKYASEEKNFRQGRSTTDLLIRFQQDIRRAQSALLRATTDEAMARVELSASLGTLLEDLKLNRD